MILGTGMDLVEIARIEQMIERFGPRFIHRILRPPEAAYCQAQARPGPHIAARFAAKEAVGKAFGTGIGRDLAWHDIEIGRMETGQPSVHLHGGGRLLWNRRQAVRLHLSLTHTPVVAGAVAILEG